MKFIHKISKITSYIIQICLLIFVLSSNSLWGEVHRTGEEVNSGEKFLRCIEKYIYMDNEKIKPTEDVEKLFNENAWQMFGCAVFIPSGHSGTLHIAKKHAKKDVTNDIESLTTISQNYLAGIYDNEKVEKLIDEILIRYTAKKHNDHDIEQDIESFKKILEETQNTEGKQDIIVGINILKERLKSRAYHTERQLVNHLIKNEQGSDPRKVLNGEFHIYASDAPCVDAVDDNNNFSCIKYYQTLREQHPRCKFHVYFPTIKLNGTFFVNNTNKEYLEKLKNLIRPYSKDYLSIFDKIDPVTKEQITNYLKKNKPGKYELIDILNKSGLNEYKTAIFKELFKIEGVEYHLMPPTKKA